MAFYFFNLHLAALTHIKLCSLVTKYCTVFRRSVIKGIVNLLLTITCDSSARIVAANFSEFMTLRDVVTLYAFL